MEINIIYEDSDIIVCEKPAGVPVQSARIGTKDMVSILKNYLSESQKKPGAPYLGLVHRLDQPVSGVMVYGKTKAAAAFLSAQITDGRMKKKYLAVVCGKLEKEAGPLVDYLFKDGRMNVSKIVKEGTKGAKRAELVYHIEQEREDCCLVKVDLLTGRHHQIRVQMAGAGMPLLGDRKYNTKCPDEADSLALAAYSLTFLHPQNKKQMSFKCQPKGKAFEKFDMRYSE